MVECPRAAPRRHHWVAAAMLAALMLHAGPAPAQQRRVEPPVKLTQLNPDKPASMLAEVNLKARRPKAPVDFTGMWMLQRTATNGPPPDWEFWPLPKLTAEAQRIYNEKLQADKEGKAYRDDAALCYPVGMPRWLTRVWPIQVIQLPTGLVMIQGFENLVRWVYMDGRKHADPDTTLPSFNGDSIGHWEGKTLVIDTVNFEPEHHWVQIGIPMSENFHLVERWTRSDDGKVLSVHLTMTDPKYWEGEWTHTKHYNLRDDRDIFEVHCNAAEMSRLPSAQPSANTR